MRPEGRNEPARPLQQRELVVVLVIFVEGSGCFFGDGQVKGVLVDAIHERLDVVMARSLQLASLFVSAVAPFFHGTLLRKLAGGDVVSDGIELQVYAEPGVAANRSNGLFSILGNLTR